ncbi:MAG: hypothetical protein OIN84_12965, partial [Candidatus Methanoperedens sp.]|nr:hypothetical protein [Candidatus Methanoperedens sp.]
SGRKRAVPQTWSPRIDCAEWSGTSIRSDPLGSVGPVAARGGGGGGGVRGGDFVMATPAYERFCETFPDPASIGRKRESTQDPSRGRSCVDRRFLGIDTGSRGAFGAAAYSGQNVELLLAQIAHRCLRAVTRARRVLTYATERNDHQALASAHADICFHGAIARAMVRRLDHHQQRGEIDDMAVARIGLDLATTLRLVETTPDHPYRVMVSSAPSSYHGSEVAETVRHSVPDRKITRPDAPPDRIRSIEAPADV